MRPEHYSILITIINIVVAGFLYRFNTYMKKKGENQATKEDIGKITNEIETVKKQHTKEIEALKSQLDINAQKKKQQYNDERNSVIIFFNAFHNLVYRGLMFNFTGYNENNIEYLHNQMILMNELNNELSIAHSKLHLFISNDSKILEYADVLLNKTNDAFIKIYNNCALYSKDLRHEYDEDDDLTPQERYYTIKANIKDDALKYEKERGTLVNNTIPIRNRFKEYAKDFLIK